MLRRPGENTVEIADAAHFSQKIKVTEVGHEREVQPGLKRGDVEVKRQSGRNAPKVWVQGPKSGNQGGKVLGCSAVANIQVFGDIGRAMRDHGQATDHHKLYLVGRQLAQDGS